MFLAFHLLVACNHVDPLRVTKVFGFLKIFTNGGLGLN
jgi:hypothetical protein